jgi:hypothetical protein
VISTRRYLETLLRGERDRMNLLFVAAWGLAAFVYYELGRRQRVGESREEHRRNYVDGELNRLRQGLDAHAQRAEGVRNVGRTAVGLATLVLGYVGLRQIGAF